MGMSSPIDCRITSTARDARSGAFQNGDDPVANLRRLEHRHQ
jgi:hypothetical protein